MLVIPPRYEAKRRLGKGGGGEVWAVADRVTGATLAFKVLAADAGEGEAMALVREAMALSGLEGLGVPRVIAFGALAGSGRRYMVRELVEGESLEDVLGAPNGTAWLEPLARASEQLTVLHRAGLLHGDIKPANIIVGAQGTATLVDLGLAAPWKEGGSTPQGLTPRYAAPELFRGQPLTVRAEVFALGATLQDGLSRRGSELDAAMRAALVQIADRATMKTPSARYPSVDELASALRSAAHLSPSVYRGEVAWPVVGLERTAQTLMAAVDALGPTEALALEGQAGSGKTTLVRRLAWTLGVEERSLATIDLSPGPLTPGEAVDLELLSHEKAGTFAGLVLVIDDVEALDEPAIAKVRSASEKGARIVAVGTVDQVRRLAVGGARAFALPPLDSAAANDLLQRAMPSLPDALRAHLIAKSAGRPGELRSYVRRLGYRALVSTAEIDEALSEGPVSVPPSGTGPSASRDAALSAIEQLLDTGRFDEAEKLLATPLTARRPGRSATDTVRVAIIQARVKVGRGDGKAAIEALEQVKEAAAKSPHKRAWQLTLARARLRLGDYAGAIEFGKKVVDAVDDDAFAAEALSAWGLAHVFGGDDTRGQATLARAVAVANKLRQPRIQAVALCSLGIAHQKAGRTSEARTTYDAALVLAEEAKDAATYATIRLNLSNLAQMEGDIARALLHLEAAVDMGKRTGALLAVQQAVLNLAGLDVFLGRYARARAALDSLVAQRGELGTVARAQLLGVEAELASRIGEIRRGAELYEQSALAWEAQNRPLDAAEARLEALLARTGEPAASAGALAQELSRDFETLRKRLGDGGFLEHEALADIVRGAIALLSGDEAGASVALDRALAHAETARRKESVWRALEARAGLAASQGNVALARRDTEAALALLEETAAKLPRDLREVFWNDPRRRGLRQAHFSILPTAGGVSRLGGTGPALGLAATLKGGRVGMTTMLGITLPAEDRLARIFEITRELATEHDIGRLLTKVTDHAIGLLGAERGFVVLANDRGELETHTARDRKGDEPHAHFSHSVAESVVRTGEPVIATSARDDARLAEALSVHQLMIQSIACVPIRGAPPAARTIGALYLETRLRPGARFEEELPTLAAFADQAAIAIENARLVSENRARAEELAHANAELTVAQGKLSEILGRRTGQLATARRDLKQVRAELRGHFGYAGLVGTSAPMRKVYSLIDRIKDADVTVLITGESGTGKEVVARAVHASGARAKKPFLGVNCGAIPANLLESELFGHVKGAFTGAERDRKGLFREAEGGTILLDEIGEMPSKMQASLLRTLQDRTVRPIGGASEEPVDTRVLAATNRDLEQMVKSGAFREDLFYRLNVIGVHVPALRERAEDIPPLIDHFLTLFAARYRRERKAVDRQALQRMCNHDWPGNVRQLEHVLLNAWLMSEGGEILLEDLQLPELKTRQGPGAAETPPSRLQPTRAKSITDFKDGERERMLGALSACNWNRVQAAKMVGLPRRTFYRRLREYGIV